MAKDIDIKCQCGWQGKQSELLPRKTEDATETVCPKCGVWFTAWPIAGKVATFCDWLGDAIPRWAGY